MISVRFLIGIAMCALVSLLGSNTVFAQGPAAAPAPTGTLQERVAELEKKSDAASLWNTLGFKISGYVDISYVQNFNNPATNVTNMRIFDTQANSFVPQLFQLMLEKPADAAGTGLERAGFRARMNFGAEARFSRARTNFRPGTDNTEMDTQEIYAEYIAPVGNGLKIQVGKINTLVGYEVINSFENPNFSRTFMFGLSQAFTTTGIRFTYTFNPMVTASIGLVNGWDNIEDNNKSKTIEYLLAFTPHPRLGINWFGTWGGEQSNCQGAGTSAAIPANGSGTCFNANGQIIPFGDPSAKRFVNGLIITTKPTDSDTVIFEPYYVNEGNAALDPQKQPTFGGNASGNARWNGMVTYWIHDFNDQTQPHAFSLRGRGEIWEDAGGFRACGGAINTNGGTNVCSGAPGAAGNAGFTTGSSVFNQVGNGLLSNGQATQMPIAQTLWETTWTLQYKPVPNLITRIEGRYDHSNETPFLRGSQPTNNQEQLGFEVIYLF
jgi:putative OmpL-like beta-barrel porin-2